LQVFEKRSVAGAGEINPGRGFSMIIISVCLFLVLAATLCAWLWLKSGYIPRGLSIFGVIASAWCVFCAFVYLIFPTFNKIVNDYIFDTQWLCSN
jgi:hypothetical protein